jgi:hypothetical protein
MKFHCHIGVTGQLNGEMNAMEVMLPHFVLREAKYTVKYAVMAKNSHQLFIISPKKFQRDKI